MACSKISDKFFDFHTLYAQFWQHVAQRLTSLPKWRALQHKTSSEEDSTNIELFSIVQYLPPFWQTGSYLLPHSLVSSDFQCFTHNIRSVKISTKSQIIAKIPKKFRCVLFRNFLSVSEVGENRQCLSIL